MDSRSTRSPCPSKIPKLQSGTSSPLSRAPSFLEGTPPKAISPKVPKTESPLSSPRQPPVRPLSSEPSSAISHHRQSATLTSPTIKSKSDGGETRPPSDLAPCSARSPPILPGQKAEFGGQGDIPQININEQSPPDIGKHVSKDELDIALAGLIPPPSVHAAKQNSEHGTTTASKPLSQPEMHSPSSLRQLGNARRNSVDLNVLYAANPIRMESTATVPPPYQRKSPTYLNLYRQQQEYEARCLAEAETVSGIGNRFGLQHENEMGSWNTVNDLQGRDSTKTPSSLEWDYSDQRGKEVMTQTSRVGTVDRASSSIPWESFSKESLLENQTPSLVLDQTTDHEESDGTDIDDNDVEQKLSCDTVKLRSHYTPVESSAKWKEPEKGTTPPEKVIKKRMDRQGSSSLSLQEWQMENLVPKLNISSSGGALEIQPSPVPLSLEELKGDWTPKRKLDQDHKEPVLASSAKSSIILKSCPSAENRKTLKSSFELINSTSFLHGYNITAIGQDKNKLKMKIHPSIGLIPPQTKTSVEISTDSNRYKNENMAKLRITVEMFRVHCDDPTKLREYYNKLQDQHPELIRTQTIERVVIWNNNKSKQMLDIINSVTEIRERQDFKADLYRRLSTESMSDPRRSIENELCTVTTGMIVANQQMRNIMDELFNIRNHLMFIVFMLLVGFGIYFIMPLVHDEYFAKFRTPEVPLVETVPEPEELPEVVELNFLEKMWNDIVSYFS